MKNVLCALCVLCGLSLAADWPTPPAGYAYETDLRPHALVLTNAATAGLAQRSDITSATNALKPTAIYTPDGQTWTDATGCVWRVDREDWWHAEYIYGDNVNWYLVPNGDNKWALDNTHYYFRWQDGKWAVGVTYISDGVVDDNVYWSTNAPSDATYLYAEYMPGFPSFVFHRIQVPVTNLVTRLANTNELANLTTTIPTIVTNTVRAVQGLVYDEKLGITWKQTMYDGNLYYVAVTNANITEVQ